MRRSAVLVLVVATVLVGVLAPVAAQDASSGAADRSLTLGDLAPGGEKPANAPASVRQNGKFGEFVVKNLPTGLMVQEGERSPSWRYMEPGTTVQRDYVQLWSKRAYGASEQTYVVRVAHWTKGQEEITAEDGSTRTEPAAQNVQTYTRRITFGGGYDYAEIDFKSHYDGRIRTTMCVQQPNEPNCLTNPGDTRWTFWHHTSKATMPIETDSAGARLAWGLGILVLPFFGMTTVTLYGGRQFVKKARGGPMISAIWWVVVAVLGGLFIMLAWDWVSGTLIRAPWLVSAAAGILLGVIAVEWFGRTTYGVGFLQFQLAEGYDPTDPAQDVEAGSGGPEDAPGRLKARFMTQRFARGPNGERSAIRKGLRKFWARARGATADLEVDGKMQTAIEVDGPIQELYLLDPEEEEPVEYQPEHHRLEIPDLLEYDEDGNLAAVHPAPYILGAGFLGLSWLAGQVLTGTGTLGLLVGGVVLLATKIATPVEGRLYAKLAPLHYNHALSAMLTHAQQLSEAKSWQDWFEEATKEKASRAADKKDLEDNKSQSQLEELFDRYVGDAPERDVPEEVTADD